MYDTIVVGAGQAGLSVGYYLKQSNKKFLSWRKVMKLEKVGK